MGLSIVQATANATPDPGFGGLAVTGISNTGHSSTTASCSSFAGIGGSDNDSQTRSANWSGFPAGPGGARILVRLKVDWAASGNQSAGADTGDGGGANADSFYDVEYSVNGGSNWNTIRSTSAGCNEISSPTSLSDNGPAFVTLSNSQDLTQVKVRERLRATSSAAGGSTSSASSSCSTISTVSSIQIEVTTVAPGMIICN